LAGRTFWFRFGYLVRLDPVRTQENEFPENPLPEGGGLEERAASATAVAALSREHNQALVRFLAGRLGSDAEAKEVATRPSGPSRPRRIRTRALRTGCASLKRTNSPRPAILRLRNLLGRKLLKRSSGFRSRP